jgi:hypothetical protein
MDDQFSLKKFYQPKSFIMKTISAGFHKTNHTIPVDLRTIHHHYFSFEPVISYIKEILANNDNRFQWMAITMLVQAIFITSIISIIILSTGNWTPLWFVTAASVYTTFIPSLSGQPLKIIKTVFMINCVVSLLIVLTAVVHSFIA